MRVLCVAVAAFAAAAAVVSAAAPTIGNTGIDTNLKVAFIGDTPTSSTNPQVSATNGLNIASAVTSTINKWIAGSTFPMSASTANNAYAS